MKHQDKRKELFIFLGRSFLLEFFASNFTLSANKHNLNVRLYPVILKSISTELCVSHPRLIYTQIQSNSAPSHLDHYSSLTLVVLQRKGHPVMVGWLSVNWILILQSKSEFLWSSSCGKHPSSAVRVKALSRNICFKWNSAPVGTKLLYYKMKGWVQSIFTWLFTDPDDT